MTVRDDTDARLANLRAALASISARAEGALAECAPGKLDVTGQMLVCGLNLKLIVKAAEEALKADEIAGGKRD